MKTAWSHLPNAVHIDRVLVSVKAHPEEWIAAWPAVWPAAGAAAWREARDVAWDATNGAAFGAVSRMAARAAIAALIAWDDCAKYLDMSSDRLRVWQALSEDPACILLLPAVVAFERIKELELA